MEGPRRPRARPGLQGAPYLHDADLRRGRRRPQPDRGPAGGARRRMTVVAARMARRGAHWLIRAYQLTLSALMGRQCRHWPSCSDYMDEAIGRHGLWAGGWMGFARVCR